MGSHGVALGALAPFSHIFAGEFQLRYRLGYIVEEAVPKKIFRETLLQLLLREVTPPPQTAIAATSDRDDIFKRILKDHSRT